MQKKYLLSVIILFLSLLVGCSSNTVKPTKTKTVSKTKKIVTTTTKKRVNIKAKVAKPAVIKKIVKTKKYTANKSRKYNSGATRSYSKKRYYSRNSYKKRYTKNRPIRKTYTQRRAYAGKKRYIRRITPNYPKRRVRRSYGSSASFAKALSNAAVARTRHKVRYDGKYIKIGYPWGDVPANIGVCTDVVIRSYRRLGIDLQKEVHEDMSQGGFYDYPRIKKWKLSAPDKNIDHRRVYNLQAFFRRHGASLPVTRNPADYRPGDLVTWMVGPELPHIGIVVEQRSKSDPRRHMIVHNIAYGPKMEDILFSFPITGHYRYNRSNKLIAGRRFQKNNLASVQTDYNRLMRELATTPTKRENTRSQKKQVGTINIAQLKSESGISDADIQLLLKK